MYHIRYYNKLYYTDYFNQYVCIQRVNIYKYIYISIRDDDGNRYCKLILYYVCVCCRSLSTVVDRCRPLSTVMPTVTVDVTAENFFFFFSPVPFVNKLRLENTYPSTSRWKHVYGVYRIESRYYFCVIEILSRTNRACRDGRSSLNTKKNVD